MINNISNFNFNLAKVRKAIVSYAFVRNLLSNLVEEYDFEEMIIEAFHPSFISFFVKLSNVIII